MHERSAPERTPVGSSSNYSTSGIAMDSLIESPEPHLPKRPLIDYLNEIIAAQSRPDPSLEKQPQWCAPLQNALTAPTLPKKSGSAGGKAANWGEPYLMQIVMDLFAAEQNPEKCKDISHLHYEYEGLLTQALKQYHDDMEKGKKYGTKVLTYGKLLKAGGMERKLRQWVKAPAFRKHLIDLGYLED